MEPVIQSFDFESPILDFSLVADEQIWVSVDGAWSDQKSDAARNDRQTVRIVQVISGDVGVRVSEFSIC